MYNGKLIIDCKGLDLTETTDTQTITGLYAKLASALTKDVDVLLKGCVYGTGKAVAPVNALVYRAASDSIIAIVSTIKITVSDANVVVIGSMIPESSNSGSDEGGGFEEEEH